MMPYQPLLFTSFKTLPTYSPVQKNDRFLSKDSQNKHKFLLLPPDVILENHNTVLPQAAHVPSPNPVPESHESVLHLLRRPEEKSRCSASSHQKNDKIPADILPSPIQTL